MPLVKRGIAHPLAYPNAQLYENSPPGLVLQNIDMASLSGAMSQLGFLASYATEMFQDLVDIAQGQSQRLAAAAQKTEAILARLPEVEEAVKRNQEMLGSAGAGEVAVRDAGEVPSGLFNQSAMPGSIKSRYEHPVVQRAPPLERMDEVVLPEKRAEWGPCAARYSNPSFFFQEWLKAEEERQQIIQEEKAKRRQERKARKEAARRRKQAEGESKPTAKKKGLNWREGLEGYENVSVDTTAQASPSVRLSQSPGGEAQAKAPTPPPSRPPPPANSQRFQPPSAPPPRPAPEAVAAEPARPAPPAGGRRPPPPTGARGSGRPAPPPPPSSAAPAAPQLPPVSVVQASTPPVLPPPPAAATSVGPRPASPTEARPSMTGAAPAPPPPPKRPSVPSVPSARLPPPVPPVPLGPVAGSRPPPPSRPDPPAPPGRPSSAAMETPVERSSLPPEPPARPASGRQPPPPARPEPPMPPAMPAAPVLPTPPPLPSPPPGESPAPAMPRPAPGGLPLGGNLLASIRDGKRLKKPEVAPAQPVDRRDNLLDMIRNKGLKNLKHVEPSAQEEKKEPAGGLVGAMDTSMAAILSRRKYLEKEESDDSSDDDDWDD